MTPTVALLIPNYNHGLEFVERLAQWQSTGIPIILVDDGSCEPSASLLSQCAAEHSEIFFIRRSTNGGKGLAVIDGLRLAKHQGFSHVVQIDADGQHEITDAARFIEKVYEYPNALIIGSPVFGTDIPHSRRWGRQISRIFVWLETLSLDINDPLCGFRAYPVVATLDIIDRERPGTRMDFDPEIAVRLKRNGLKVMSVPTRITYPTNGHSNFRLYSDNIKISFMHTRLIFESLFKGRTPKPKHSPITSCQQKQGWDQLSEVGAAGGLRLMLWIYRTLGRRFSAGILFFVILYFFCTQPAKRHWSKLYLERLRSTAKNSQRPLPPIAFESFRHFWSFGLACLDKMFFWSGHCEDIQLDWSNRQQLYAHLASGRGAVVLGAHLGNIEVLRAAAQSHGAVQVRALMFTRNAQRFNAILKRLNPCVDTQVIAVENIQPSTVLSLKKWIDGGGLLAIMSDRIPPGSLEKTVTVPFLGHPAQLPQGPFVLSFLMECPVFSLFCLRQGTNRYRVIMDKLSDRLELPRAKRQELLTQVAAKFCEQLQSACLEAPHQWFNFYDYWADASASAKPPLRPVRHV